MLAKILVVRLVSGFATVQITEQQPVNHQIGIAADRRREMRVERERESVMSDIVGGIDSLRHTLDGKHRDCILFGASLHLCQNLVERLSDEFLVVHIDGIAKLADELLERVQLLQIGFVVDTIDESLWRVALVLLLTDESGYALVGEEHKLLHEPIRLLGLLEINADRLALLVDFKFDFGGLKRD